MDQLKRLQQAVGEARAAIEDVVLGYQIAPGPERAAMAATLSFGCISLATASPAAVIGSDARGRCRPSRARLGAAGSLMTAAGLAAALNRDDGREARYAVPFGFGAGLAVNEAHPAAGLAGVAAAVLGLSVLVRDLHRRGAVHRALRQLAGA